MVVSAYAVESESFTLESPDESLTVTVDIRDRDGATGIPVYNLSFEGRKIVGPSRLGMMLDETAIDGNALAPMAFAQGLEVVATETGAADSTWAPVYGERSTVRDHYNSLAVTVRRIEPPRLEATIEFRAYNEGIAFCYRVPEQSGLDKIRISHDLTEFRFSADHDAWAVYSAQGRYKRVPISEIERGCERPLLLRTADEVFMAIAEARLVDFARMKLAPLPESAFSLVADLNGKATCGLPFRSPWRVVMVGRSPGALLENNDLLLNLNDPCAIEDTSWIKPGKVIREVTLTTDGGRACVDFAAAHGIQYVEFDAGWYGHEYDDAADATTVSVDPKRSPGPLDLPAVIRYASESGVGIILYVNRRALEKQIDALLPLFKKWGIKGVKYGFVNVGSQRWTSWLHDAVGKAAAHELMVDVHDEYRPTGFSRTYPNLMTQEGIAGDETSPTNEQTLTILFTRMLCGAADNTICYYDSRVDRQASHAYQLAKAVCLYSPWQFLYWYDRPIGSPGTKGGAGGQKNAIGREPELEFFDHLPVVWDDTHVICGAIGEYALIARRSGQDWYVGCMNGAQPRTVRLPLDFLDGERGYVAHIYSDDSTVKTRTQVRIDRLAVNAVTVLDVDLAARCGQAIRIAAVREVFVSPTGADSNPGTRAAPFRTLEAARDSLRDIDDEIDLVVTLLEGRYFRTRTFALESCDAGHPGHTITYQAEPGAAVIVDGGLFVSGEMCAKVTDPAISNRLPPKAHDTVYQLDLRSLGVDDFGEFGPRGFGRPTLPAPVEVFIDGQPLAIARWPNEGEPRIPLGEVLDKGSVPRHGDMSNRGGVFRYDTERALRWIDAPDLYISGIFTWGFADDTVRIARIDPQEGTFTTVQSYRYGCGNSKQKSLWKWHAVNLLEEIDIPGEYYVDRGSGMAYLLPFASAMPIEDATLQVSLMAQPMVVMDKVSHLRWKGITFENTRDTAVRIDGGEDVLITGCTFRNLGKLAVRMAGSRHGVLSCDVHDCGAGGIAMSGGDRRTLQPGGCFVRNCDISRVNRWYKTYRPCVSIAVVGNRIEHCHLHDCPGQAVLLSGNDHVIEYNEMGRLIGEMSDQGAIYMGRNPSHAGNIFRYNFFHDTDSSHVGGYGNSGIFFDDGDSGQYVYGNVFYRCGSNGAVKYHGGQFNTFINNLVIDCRVMIKYDLWNQKRWTEFLESELQQTRLLREVDILSEPYKSRYPRLAAIFERPYSRQRQTEERNYVTTAADPLLADGPALDFTIVDEQKLREAMPGFEPIPFEAIGTYRDEFHTTK